MSCKIRYYDYRESYARIVLGQVKNPDYPLVGIEERSGITGIKWQVWIAKEVKTLVVIPNDIREIRRWMDVSSLEYARNLTLYYFI